jgi:TatA/E family protein of Tat protein translocase
MPFGLQPIHLIVVAIVALLIFGPSKLPEIGRGVGKALTEFRRGAKDMGGSFMEEIKQADETSTQAPMMTQPIAQAAPAGSVSMTPAEPAAQGNFCIHCGKSNPAAAVFCNHCGSKIAEVKVIE